MVQIETPVDYRKTVSWNSWEAGLRRWSTGIILVSPLLSGACSPPSEHTSSHYSRIRSSRLSSVLG